jgi:putative membrane protein
MMWDYGAGWWSLWGIIMFLVWGGFIALIIWGVIKLSKRDGEKETKSNALDIAKERYAKGEIAKEEFEQIKKDLK